MRYIFSLTITILLLLAPLPSAAEEIIINAVGDIMLAGKWTHILKQKGYDFYFDKLRGELADGDINLANLESPIAGKGVEFRDKKYRFKAEPAVAAALKKAGFNLVTVANNHSMDFGYQALSETFTHLDKAGIAWTGGGKNLEQARKSVVYWLNNRRMIFLSYSLILPLEFFAGENKSGTAPAWNHFFVPDITKARQQKSDLVVVSFHWGDEGSNMVREKERMAAHAAIDAGADIIIGHHPHVLQGVERYKKGIIFYSLGNCVFASRSNTARYGALIKLRVGEQIREAEVLPLDVDHNRTNFQPRILSGKAAEPVINELNRLSKPFGTVIQQKGERFKINF